MSDILRFPSRARTQTAPSPENHEHPRERLEKWNDGKEWIVDHVWLSGRSRGMIGHFQHESQADACIREWEAANSPEPGGAE